MTDTDTTRLKAKATEMSGWLEYRTRPDDEKFITCKAGAPDWVKDIVFDAHDNMLVNDYSYEYVNDALEVIMETDSQEDAQECMENRTEIYNSEMIKWLASNLGRAEYVDEAVSNYGYKDLYSALQLGMAFERAKVLDIVWAGLERQIERETAAAEEKEG